MRPLRRRRFLRRRALGLLLAVVLGLSVGGLDTSGNAQASPTCDPGLELTGDPLQGPAPLPVNFSLTVGGGVPSKIAWSFGDGGVWNTSGRFYTTLVHTYSAAGTFAVLVTVVEGSTELTCRASVVAGAPALTASLAAASYSGRVPFQVNFTGSGSGGTGTYVSFQWTFGDGGTGTGPQVSYTYLHAGEFQANLTVTDSNGTSATAHAQIEVATNTSTSPPIGRAPTPSSSPPTAIVVLELGIAVGAIASIAVLVGTLRHRRENPHRGVDFRTRSPPGPDDAPPARIPTARSPGAGTALSARAAEAGAPLGVPSPRPLSNPGHRRAAKSRTSPDRTSLTVAQRALVRLHALGPIESYDVPPDDFSQVGLARFLRVRQGFLSNVLAKLRTSGLVVNEVRRVRGSSRRLRVYRLTPVGASLARDLAQRSRRPEAGTGTEIQAAPQEPSGRVPSIHGTD